MTPIILAFVLVCVFLAVVNADEKKFSDPSLTDLESAWQQVHKEETQSLELLTLSFSDLFKPSKLLEQ